MKRKGNLLIAMTLLVAGLSFGANAAQAGSDRLPLYGTRAPASADAQMPAYAAPMPVPSGAAVQGYVLGIGDRVKLTVYGEADLSGDYEVGSTGMISLPLIGDVSAAGQTATVFEQSVRQKLSQGYLRDPRVSAQVVNYRPFFILGEVSKPGSYPYVNGMTVVNAVALAGGYTYRADRKGITIKRANEQDRQENAIAEEGIVMPGDVLHVPERFF